MRFFLKGRLQALLAIRSELERQYIRVGLIGVTSSGKSTFINALLGEALLPEQSKPTSNVLVYARKGPERLLTVYYKDTSKRPDVLGSEKINPEILLKYTSEDHNPGNRMGIARVEIELPTALTNEIFELVDTPGLDAYGLEWHQRVTLDEFVPQSDVIIYMTSIRNPFKRSDVQALERVLEHDQRVLFVISGKGLERDDREGGRVIRRREHKLSQHIERLKRDASSCIGLRAAGYVLVDSKASLHSKKEEDKELWHWSGFPEVLNVLSQYGCELSDTIYQSRISRAKKHVLEAINLVEAQLATGRGDKKKIGALLDGLKNKIDLLRKTKDKVSQELEKIICDQSESILDSLNLNTLSENDSEISFKAQVDAFDKALSEAYLGIQENAAKLRDSLIKTICLTGLEAPRSPIPETSLKDLPAASVKLKSKTVTRVRKVDWGFRWRFWPHEERYQDTVSVCDVSNFALEMNERVDTGLNRLQHHVHVIKRQFRGRFLNVIDSELTRAQQELRNITGNAKKLRADDETLTAICILLRKVEGQLAWEKNAGINSPEKYKYTPAAPSETSGRNKRGVILLPVLENFRELEFHRRFLRIFSSLAQNPPGHHIRAAILGLDVLDRWHLANMLLHRLHKPIQRPSSCQATFLMLQGAFPGLCPLFYHEVIEIEQSDFLERASIFIGDSDEAVNNWHEVAGPLAKWADIFLILVDGPRIGSGLSDLRKAPYHKHLSKFMDKVIYVIPHGAKFDDKLRELPAQIYPNLIEMGPYGKRPVIVYENYDVRYTDYLELVHSSSSATEFRRKWIAKRLPLDFPFSYGRLEDIYVSSVINEGENPLYTEVPFNI